MTRWWRNGGTPDPDPTDDEIRAAIGLEAGADPAYRNAARVYGNRHPDTAPAFSDAIGWAEWALARRDTIPAGDYYSLTGPWSRVMGRAHPDDTHPDDTTPTGLDTPDAWRRFPHKEHTP